MFKKKPTLLSMRQFAIKLIQKELSNLEIKEKLYTKFEMVLSDEELQKLRIICKNLEDRESPIRYFNQEKKRAWYGGQRR